MNSLSPVSSNPKLADYKYDNVIFKTGLDGIESMIPYKATLDDITVEFYKPHNFFENIPDDKPVKQYYDVDIKIPYPTDEDTSDIRYSQLVADGILTMIKDYINHSLRVLSGNDAFVSDFFIKTAHYSKREIFNKETQNIDFIYGYSFHIYINNFACLKKDQKILVKELNNFVKQDQQQKRSSLDEIGCEKFTEYLEDGIPELFDEAVYNQNQFIRCIDSSKPNEKRPFILHEGDIKDSLISLGIRPDAFLYTPTPKKIIPSYRNIDVSESSLTENMMIVNSCFEQKLLASHANTTTGWTSMGLWLKGYFGDTSESYSLFDKFSKLCPSKYCEYSNRDRWEGFQTNGKYDNFGVFVNKCMTENAVAYKIILASIKTALKEQKKIWAQKKTLNKEEEKNKKEQDKAKKEQEKEEDKAKKEQEKEEDKIKKEQVKEQDKAKKEQEKEQDKAKKEQEKEQDKIKKEQEKEQDKIKKEQNTEASTAKKLTEAKLKLDNRKYKEAILKEKADKLEASNADKVIAKTAKEEAIKISNQITQDTSFANLTGDALNLYQQYLKHDIRTDGGAALFLKDLNPTKFIWIKPAPDADGELYGWADIQYIDGVVIQPRWEKGRNEFVRFILVDGVKELGEIKERAISELTDKGEFENKILATIVDNIYWGIKGFKSMNIILNIIKVSEAFLTRNDVEFDANADILGFNNGVYDLISHTFREYRYDDYITMTVGYDFNPHYCPTSLVELRAVLESIMPNPENLQMLLEVLSGGLTGRVIEKFVLFNGGGRNGKGLIDEFAEIMFGEYALIYANVSLLTEKERTGANPEKAKLHRKRLVIMKEPDGDECLLNSNVNSLTGGGNVSGRMLFSNVTNVVLCMILVMECNKRPKFKTVPCNAELERVNDLLFPNLFTSDEDKINNIDVFKQNPKFKTKEWKETHRDAFLHLLIEAFKVLQSNNYEINVPMNVKIRSNDYLNKSVPLIELFNDDYEKTDNPTDIISLNDVYKVLSNSDTFFKYTKSQKREYNLKYFINLMSSNIEFRQNYFERKNNNRNILIGYRQIPSLPPINNCILDIPVDDSEIITEDDMVEE